MVVNEMPKPERLVPCPRCRKAVIWDTNNPARPFCSKRCQMIDLGKWFDEEHRISGEPGMDEQAPNTPSED